MGARTSTTETRGLLRQLLELRLEAGLILLGVSLVWGAIGLMLAQEHDSLRQDALHDTATFARALEENINRTVEGIDQTLRFARSSYERDPEHFDLVAWAAKNQPDRDDLTIQIGIVSRDGIGRGSSAGPYPTPVDVSDREHFRVQRDAATDRLFISRPVLGRGTGRWSVQFTRRLADASGAFAGVMVVSIDPYSLSRFYGSMDLDGGTIVLVGADGIVRARAPRPSLYIGQDLSGSPLLAGSRQAESGSEETQDPAAGAVFSSFRRIDRYGLTVIVSLPEALVYAPLHRYELQLGAAGLLFSALILALGVMVMRRRRALIDSQAVLLRSRETLTAAVENISQGVLMVDASQQIRLISRRAKELLDLPPHIGREDASFDEMLRWQVESGEFGEEDGVFGIYRSLAARGGIDAVREIYERVRPNGTVLEVRTQHLPGGGIVRTFADITQRKHAEARIRHLAHHDALTALANRRMFNEHLADAIARADLDGASGFAVLSIDLDRFKVVNDLRGHAVGDKLLVQVADRIRSAIREADWAARFGGDEFAVLQTQADQPRAAAALARRLIELICEPYVVDGQAVQIGASVGVALCPAHGLTADQLLRNADTALYRAKGSGRCTFRIFEPAMDNAVQERRRLEQDLRRALSEEQLSLDYQPICHIDTGEPVSFEALLRWKHPVRGNVPPGDFISAAEESGMIVPLGRWVLRAACADAGSGLFPGRLAVNLSPAQFHDPDLPIEVAEILRQTGYPPQMLTLEVTEGVLIDDSDRALSTMQELKRLGLRIALDDFGTGHASLSYLRRFPFDSIKVDRSFVQCLETDRSACAIVRSILTLGRNLGLDVVAEGVETEEQLRLLRDFGYTLVQGFLLGRPVPRDQVQRRYGETAAEHHVPVALGSGA